MRPVYLPITTQSGASGLVVTAPVPLDINVAPFNVACQIGQVSGNLKITLQHTADNVFSSTFDASAATWFNNTSATTISAATIVFYVGQPITAVRLTQSAGGVYSGGATLTVIQGEAT